MIAQAAGLAVLAAISPTALLLAAVYLGSARPRATVLCYLAGALVMSVAIGIVALCSGIGLFFAKVWARAVAIIVAAFSILANFAWLPYYPVWALLVIGFDLFVIWAVAVHGSDFRTA